MTAVRKSRSPRNSQLAEGVGKKRLLDKAIYQWTFPPRNLLGKGVTERMVECGHRESTSSASDASGEAGSEQGWSVVGPPGKRASKNSSLEP